MVDLEASFDCFVVLLIRPALSDRVVAGHDNLLRPDRHVASLCVRLERVMVRPLLHPVGPDLLRTHLFDDNHGLSLVCVPPEVV